MPDETVRQIEDPQALEAWSQSPPKSIVDLRVLVELMFHSMRGPPRAYFEVPLAHPTEEQPFERMLYTVVGYEDLAAERGQGVHEALLDKLWHFFRTARLLVEGKGCALLFWRRVPEFDEWVSVETKKRYLRLSARLVIPGVDLTPWKAEWTKLRGDCG